MAILDDFILNYDAKAIRRLDSASGNTYSVNQLYSALQDLFDESGQMDDPVPMSAQTPVEYTLINDWFLDYASTHSLSGGSIQTSGLSGKVHLLTFGGTYTNALTSDLYRAVSGSTTNITGTLLDYNNTTKEWWVRSSQSWTGLSETVSVVGGNGTGALNGGAWNTGEYIFSNIYTLGTLVAGTQLYVLQGSSVIPPWWSSGQIDILVQVKKSGSIVAGSDLTVFAREYGNTYDHFLINAPSGRNAVPLAIGSDGFNTTSSATVSAYSGITINFAGSGEYLRDLDNGNGSRPYKVEIDCATSGLAYVYEYLKYKTMRAFTSDIDAGSETVYGYIYQEASNTGAYAAVKSAPFGTYTGKFFGARGVYFTNLNIADVKNFSLIDNNGVTQDPPNRVSVTVTNVVSGDSVFVSKLTGAGGSILKNQYTLSATPLSSIAIFSNSAIAGETPKSGKIRVYHSGTNTEQTYSFSGWTGSIFYINGAVPTSKAYTTADYAYVPAIDMSTTSTQASSSIVYSADIPVIVRVRKKGIQPFEIESTITTNGLTVAAIRTTDTIVT